MNFLFRIVTPSLLLTAAAYATGIDNLYMLGLVESLEDLSADIISRNPNGITRTI